MHSWRRLAAIGACAIGFGPIGLLSGVHPGAAQGGALAPAAPFCRPAATPATAEAPPIVDLFTAPPGAPATELLAVGTETTMPALDRDKGTSLVLTLYRLALEPGAESTTFVAPGPILLVPEQGAIELAVNGQPIRLESGTCLLIDLNEPYALFNVSGAPATVLRLAVTPARLDHPIGVPDVVTITPAPGETPAPYQVGISAERLLRAEVTPPARGTLFIARARLATPLAEAAWFRHPGPVALTVEQGQALLDDAPAGEERRLGAADCAALPPDLPSRLAHDSSAETSLLLVGALRDREALWLPADPTAVPPDPATPPTVECGGAVTTA